MTSKEEEYVRHDGPKHRGPEHLSPYPVSRLAAPMDLVDAAREIQKADQTITSHVNSRLQVIAEQMRSLREQAHRIMDEARRDAELHRAGCQFKKRPGHTYHLYRKPSGATYFSMLSPEDWRGNPPHEPLGSYRLEADMSWTPAERDQDMAERDRALRDVKQLLEG